MNILNLSCLRKEDVRRKKKIDLNLFLYADVVRVLKMKKMLITVYVFTLVLLLCSCSTSSINEKYLSPEEAFSEKNDISVFSSKSLFSVCEQVGIPTDAISDLESGDNVLGRRAYTFYYETSTVKVYLLVNDGTFCQLSVDGTVIYDSGEVLQNIHDIVLTYEQIQYLETYSQELIYDQLKAPSTAQFGPLKCYRDETQFLVIGYVDAQNSFGAMIRTDFKVTYIWPHDDRRPTLLDCEF